MTFLGVAGTKTETGSPCRSPDSAKSSVSRRVPLIQLTYTLTHVSRAHQKTEIRSVDDVVDMFPSLEKPRLRAVPIDPAFYDQWARPGKIGGASNKALLQPITSSSSKAGTTSKGFSSSGSQTATFPSSPQPGKDGGSENYSVGGVEDSCLNSESVTSPTRDCNSIDDILQHYSDLFPRTAATREKGTGGRDRVREPRAASTPVPLFSSSGFRTPQVILPHGTSLDKAIQHPHHFTRSTSRTMLGFPPTLDPPIPCLTVSHSMDNQPHDRAASRPKSEKSSTGNITTTDSSARNLDYTYPSTSAVSGSISEFAICHQSCEQEDSQSMPWTDPDESLAPGPVLHDRKVAHGVSTKQYRSNTPSTGGKCRTNNPVSMTDLDTSLSWTEPNESCGKPEKSFVLNSGSRVIPINNISDAATNTIAECHIHNIPDDRFSLWAESHCFSTQRLYDHEVFSDRKVNNPMLPRYTNNDSLRYVGTRKEKVSKRSKSGNRTNKEKAKKSKSPHQSNAPTTPHGRYFLLPPGPVPMFEHDFIQLDGLDTREVQGEGHEVGMSVASTVSWPLDSIQRQQHNPPHGSDISEDIISASHHQETIQSQIASRQDKDGSMRKSNFLQVPLMDVSYVSAAFAHVTETLNDKKVG